MILRVDPDAPVPPFEQIRAQMATMVTTGQLTEGTRLPTIRQLASDLGLAPGTVARAYRELEQDQRIVSRGRHGTFVIGSTKRETRARVRDRQLTEAAAVFAAAAHDLGVDGSEALAEARRALEGFGLLA
jgi:DNA-binding transcriptional regulator YhcF (GntR family)